VATSGEPPSVIVPPSIDGDPLAGTTLYGNVGDWAGTPTPVFDYQWKRNDQPISGATLHTYVPGTLDVNTTLTLEIRATNDYGVAFASSTGLYITNPAPVIQNNPVISGSQFIGNTLTTTSGDWYNIPHGYAYQWKRDGADILGATSTQYVLVSADSGHTITCQVTATNMGGSGVAVSNGISAITPSSAPVNVGLPDITGNPNVGALLMAHNGSWANGPYAFTHQWKRDGVVIPGATGSNYLVTAADFGGRITLTVTAINVIGSTIATSQPTSEVIIEQPVSPGFQPQLPLELPPSDAEFAFMQEEPPGFFPENQDSNFGFVIRKMWSDQLQQSIDQQQLLYGERFIDTSTEFLDEWEKDVGLPPGRNLTVTQRRALVKSRLRKTAFTRTMRRQIVEDFLTTIYMQPIQLLPPGVPLVADGVPIGAEPGAVSDLYSITEIVEQFHYVVGLAPTVSIDEVLLTRELNRVTPAGISFDFAHFEIFSIYQEYATYQELYDAWATYDEIFSNIYSY
jgi:hypothetical protein